MNPRVLTIPILAVALIGTGCGPAPGDRPGGAEPAQVRPDQVMDFATLYGQNCAGCHGDHGQNGAAISLANPVYLATVSVEDLRRITAKGVPGTAMPPFAKSAGGMLTDAQIDAVVQGMVREWSKPQELTGQKLPAYASSGAGDAAHGQAAFGAHCASCHGTDGNGLPEKAHTGSLIDPSYLALITDQGLRSIVIAGKPEDGMPDWRSNSGSGGQPLSDQEITDIVAWLASHRVQNPGQVYQHP
jgi:mono/diheme cytochrome c family protein